MTPITPLSEQTPDLTRITPAARHWAASVALWAILLFPPALATPSSVAQHALTRRNGATQHQFPFEIAVTLPSTASGKQRNRAPGRIRMHPWPMFGGNAQHTWRGPGGATSGKVLWKQKLPDMTGCAPVIGRDGKLYLSVARQLLEVDARTGKILHSTPLSGPTSSVSALLDDHGRVYIGQGDYEIGHFYCVDVQQHIPWRTELKGRVLGAPVEGADGTLYVGTYKNWLYALDPADGRHRWELYAGGESSAQDFSPVLTPEGLLVVGNGKDQVIGVDARSGAIRWTCKVPAMVDGIPTLDPDGTVYVGSSPLPENGHEISTGFLNAIDGRTGKLKWRFQTGGQVYSGVAVGKDGIVYAGCLDSKVYALDARSGAVKWIFKAEYGVMMCLIGADGMLYVESMCQLCALDSATGKQKWKWDFGPGEFDGHAVAGAQLATDSDGTLYLTVAKSFVDASLYAVR